MYQEGPGLTAEQAEQLYDVLVEHAGASESQREMFVHNQTSRYETEWRFMGSLGAGGKVWRGTSSHLRVSCYAEDETPERVEAMRITNEALKELDFS